MRLEPNRWDCQSCGFPFLISRKVLTRNLDCLNCGRVWYYVRSEAIPTIFTVTPRGGFNSFEEREIKIALKAREEADDIQFRRQAKSR